ncbi:hypothetical protein ILUMI_10700 [Ignelater luminosus]|uniref:Gamma-interferon-inducible lysosomal thiol reductase n=1 Tax=Ignelater luminosus TaxID=2038154 RepID=A0A8K0CXE8_IGNLU|nr:hypothetical protein ILUMI_10700 [Ignelater luminosus]
MCVISYHLQLFLNMKFCLLTMILGCLYFQHSLQQMDSKPLVTIFYKPLCPYSQIFITNVLYPVYADLGTYIQVDFIPYGNIKRQQVNDAWTYECQHGPEECAISRLQACGIAKSREQDSHMEYVYCIESEVDTTTDIQTLAQCASKLELPGDEVLKCVEGPEGDKLVGLFGDKQQILAPDLSGVPTVYINNTNLDDYTALKKTLCDILHNNPEACTKKLQE